MDKKRHTNCREAQTRCRAPPHAVRAARQIPNKCDRPRHKRNICVGIPPAEVRWVENKKRDGPPCVSRTEDRPTSSQRSRKRARCTTGSSPSAPAPWATRARTNTAPAAEGAVRDRAHTKGRMAQSDSYRKPASPPDSRCLTSRTRRPPPAGRIGRLAPQRHQRQPPSVPVAGDRATVLPAHPRAQELGLYPPTPHMRLKHGRLPRKIAASQATASGWRCCQEHVAGCASGTEHKVWRSTGPRLRGVGQSPRVARLPSPLADMVRPSGDDEQPHWRIVGSRW